MASQARSGPNQKGVVMGHSAMQVQAVRHSPRGWVALGFAALAVGAVVVASGTLTRSAHAAADARVAIAVPGTAFDLGATVDWDRVADGPVTPAESVAAYDR